MADLPDIEAETRDFVRRLLGSPEELRRAARTEAGALEAFVAARWPSGARRCPSCRSGDSYTLSKGRAVGKAQAQCKSCRRTFSPLTGTLLGGEKAPIQAIVWAFGLAGKYAGRELGRQIAKRAEVSASSGSHLALLVHECEEALGIERPKRDLGWSRWIVTGGVFVLMVVALWGVLSLAAAANGPLHEEWIHAGEKRMLTTTRRPSESPAQWHARHCESLSAVKAVFPPDARDGKP